MTDLRVELYGHPMGSLIGTDWRTFDFQTDRAVFEHFDLGSTVLSESVPLEATPNRSRAARRRNYFSELLPEGRILTNLAASIRASESDALALLAHFGRDVAGAVQIYDPARPGEPRTPRTNPLTESSVADLLRNTQSSPLGNSPVAGKSSLAGVQDKIVLARIDGEWNQVLDGYPSTHIVKPESRDYPTVIFDEEYGARIIRACGLAEYTTELHSFDAIPALVIERYDRSPAMPLGRIHQEDMNQVLGARGIEKYQEYGGKVSLQRIATVLRRQGDHASLERLLRLVVVSTALGNLDLHAKNISLLHLPDGSSILSPAYDVVPMRHQPNDGRMAMSIDGVYLHAQLTHANLIAEAESWGLRNSARLIDATLSCVAESVASENPVARAHDGLAADIRGFTHNLQAGKPVGDLRR